MQEKLDIAESVVTIIMFVMAVWGTVISIEQGFWHKLNHIVNHYHHELNKAEEHILVLNNHKSESKRKSSD